MKYEPFVLAVASLFGVGSIAAAQTTSISANNGTASMGQVGGYITVTNINLDQGGTASMTCPVTAYGSGPYTKNWYCGQGTLSVNGQVVALITPTQSSPTLTYTCAGGGRGGRVTCSYHFFSATQSLDRTQSGTMSWTSSSSSVQVFNASW